MSAKVLLLALTFGHIPPGGWEIPRHVCYKAYKINLDGKITISAEGGRVKVVHPRCVVWPDKAGPELP